MWDGLCGACTDSGRHRDVSGRGDASLFFSRSWLGPAPAYQSLSGVVFSVPGRALMVARTAARFDRRVRDSRPPLVAEPAPVSAGAAAQLTDRFAPQLGVE